jgi:diguanylate cyclase (GGDEF)-like protein
MLAGFAPIARSGWGVVAQRPKEPTLAGLDHHVLNVLAKILPIGLLTLVLIWLTAGSISKPLRQLAHSAGSMDSGSSEATISGTQSWYFEAEQLKRALLKGVRLMHGKINQLRLDSSTDPMTGLLNRRGLQEVLERYEASGQSFSAITLDIDHFKNVNDTFGHDVGDSVIRKLAELMRTSARKDDALCRVGGEEFLLILPDTDLSIAKEVAERLRNLVAEHPIPIVGSITISLGIAHRPDSADTIESVLKLADHALYKAKRTGRNQTVAA